MFAPDQKEQSKTAESVAYSGGSPTSVPAGMNAAPEERGSVRKKY